MALTLCLSMAAPAFATDVAEDSDVSANAVVYEDEHIVIYDTRADASSSARATSYENHWFDPGYVQFYDLKISTSLRGTYGMTVSIEDNSHSAETLIRIGKPNGSLLASFSLGNIDGQWVYEWKSTITLAPAGTWTIGCGPVNAPNGCRIMCWIYDV